MGPKNPILIMKAPILHDSLLPSSGEVRVVRTLVAWGACNTKWQLHIYIHLDMLNAYTYAYMHTCLDGLGVDGHLEVRLK